MTAFALMDKISRHLLTACGALKLSQFKIDFLGFDSRHHAITVGGDERPKISPPRQNRRMEAQDLIPFHDENRLQSVHSNKQCVQFILQTSLVDTGIVDLDADWIRQPYAVEHAVMGVLVG